jgi:hypothetical protein
VVAQVVRAVPLWTPELGLTIIGRAYLMWHATTYPVFVIREEGDDDAVRD